MADDDAIQRKRERLAAETYEYFWNICPELTARWKRAMLTLPPSVLQDLAVEIQHLGAVTKFAPSWSARPAPGHTDPENVSYHAWISNDSQKSAEHDGLNGGAGWI